MNRPHLISRNVPLPAFPPSGLSPFRPLLSIGIPSEDGVDFRIGSHLADAVPKEAETELVSAFDAATRCLLDVLGEWLASKQTYGVKAVAQG